MTTTTYNPDTMLLNFEQAQRAVRVVDHDLMVAWHTARTTDEAIPIDRKRDERKWISREIQRYKMHPVIEAAVKLARPYDWQQLFLEWPHTAQGDASRIAYTQNEDKGRRDIQTITSIGKYLNRHFALPDHIIRDLVAQHGIASEFKFVHTTAEMIYHLHRGPGSCMVWSDDRGVRCLDGVTRHPYEAYNPKYGWHMAVRIEGDDTIGRALCMNNPDTGGKYYVRSYAKSREGSYSQSDNGMENWLKEQGYTKHTSWANGEKLAYHETHDEFLAPYLDGSDKCVSVVGSQYLVIDDEGEYACDQTGGSPSSVNHDTFECAQCGEDTDEDDGYWVGRNEDERVCHDCLDDDFVYAYGRRGNQYYIATDNAVYVESQSEWYDPDYLGDNEIVELENGEYEAMDEAVEVDGDWYHIDDERICRTEDTDEYMLTDDCWQCEESGNWYTDSVEAVEIDGNQYHPDHAPERDDAEDDGDTAVATKPVTTPLTREMLDKVQMVWDYTLNAEQVTISMTLTHDGQELHTHRVYNTEFVNGIDHDAFLVFVRNVLSTDLLAITNSTTETI